jgi:hypothetical protein
MLLLSENKVVSLKYRLVKILTMNEMKKKLRISLGETGTLEEDLNESININWYEVGFDKLFQSYGALSYK